MFRASALILDLFDIQGNVEQVVVARFADLSRDGFVVYFTRECGWFQPE
jgi:hypothetical protein